MGGTFKITDASGATDTQCFVTKYTNSGGSDDWFAIGVAEQSWARGPGWELVAFRNGTADSHRRGWYLNIPQGATVLVTFYGFDRDLGLSYA
ncbi:hypothetical protein HYPSUDRAFT_86997 [Hypholoma sublateritium FD-334 SS-4]|uniref:Uncharacterized protein n=1 Tax=Hypholoma sublateritium (strain FD-334 SS-4) TaxID=945553 RepID=A0A0D2NWI4_HYPSF|nr:hypothetical protein HYPSUDRAFT_86997 [Hypholoma sublateritium FD-334 SS-4]